MIPELLRRFPKLRLSLTGRLLFDINPEILSWCSLLLAILSGFLFSRDLLIFGSVALGMSALLDVLDGDIARKYKKASAFGDFMDHTFDRISDFAIIAGIGLSSFVSFELSLLAYISVLLVSYMGTQAHALTDKRLYDGLMGRGDRMSLLFFGGIASFFYSPILNYVIWAIMLASIITFIQRFVSTWKKLR